MSAPDSDQCTKYETTQTFGFRSLSINIALHPCNRNRMLGIEALPR